MSIWALSDPHLSFGSNKPMDVFGEQWQNHPDLIEANWRAVVTEEDTVLIPGDISWGMNFREALPDLAFIDRLPGHKLIGRGNHDYWWNSMNKLEQFADEHGMKSIRFMRNNAFAVENIIVANTRGWILPSDRDYTSQDDKIFKRELIRLRLSLDEAQKLRQAGQDLLLTLHYPPLDPSGKSSDITAILQEYDVTACIYGHVHGRNPHASYNGWHEGIWYRNTACDFLDFKPLLLYGETRDGNLPIFPARGYNVSKLNES